jgi:hypothetical protein
MPPHAHGRSRVHFRRPRVSQFRGGRDAFLIEAPIECYCDGEPCLCPPLETSGLVRSPILTAGFYWYDAPPAQAPGFIAWLRDNVALVKVRKTTTGIDTDLTGNVINGHVWALFEVLFPVPWLDAKQFGFPNTATKDTGPDVVSSGAEPQKNAIDTVADSVKGVLPFLAPVSSGVIVLGGLVGLGYVFRKEIFSNVGKRIRKHQSARSR